MAILFYQIAAPASTTAAPRRIAVIPFQIHAQGNFEFLKSGIVAMLTSRLSWENRVTVIGKEETLNALAGTPQPLDETGARTVGRKLNADHVLFGSLTVLGNSVSIDAKVIDVSGTRPPFTFFNQSRGMEEVIPKINLFAEDINARLFQRAVVARRAPAPAPAPRESLYQHPEKLLKGGADVEGQDGRSILMPGEGRILTQKFWKSHNFRFLVNALAVGDINADGKNETVVITPHSVRIYRFEQNRLIETEKLAQNRQHTYIGVDVADINGNGRAEIFVTSQNNFKNGLKSFVIEFDGQKYVKIVDGSHWFYRVAQMATRGKILLGQRYQAGDPFAAEIIELAWNNGDYRPQSAVKTPARINLLGYSPGNVLNDGDQGAVAFRHNDRMQVINSAGEEEWRGSDRYGGSMLHFLGPKTELGQVENRLFLPMRILVLPPAASRATEIIAAKNYELAGHKMGFRKFVGSHIESFAWDGLGLKSNWRTRKISGHVSDMFIADFDDDGKEELIAAIILKEGSIAFTEKKSTLIAYELN